MISTLNQGGRCKTSF